MSNEVTTQAQDTPKSAEEATHQVAESLYGKPEAQKQADAKPAVTAEAPKAEVKEAPKPEEKSKEQGQKPDSKEGETKKDETKDASKEQQKAPEKYELKLPKDALIDRSRLEKIAEFAKTQNLTQDQAQAMVERENDAAKSFQVAQQEGLKVKASEWFKEVENDKELGGQNFKQSAEFAKRALDRFASDTLKKQLSETGLGNYPELVRAFARIGKAMGDDKLVLPGSRDVPTRSYESILYGDSSNNNS